MRLLNLFKYIFTFYQIIYLAKGSGNNDGLPVHVCDSGDSLCLLTEVNLNKTHYEFIVATRYPNLVLITNVDGCVLPILSSTICDAFPNMYSVYYMGNQIEEISDGAFATCKNVNSIELTGNNLKKLDENVFAHNEVLWGLGLSDNQLEHLDINVLAYCKELTSLGLNGNNLNEFPAEILRNNAELRFLSLQNNNLKDLDGEQLLEYLPKLEIISFYGNKIPREREQELIETFEAAGVKVTLSPFKIK